MVGLGVWLSGPIMTKATEKYLRVAASVMADTDDKFDYIARTDVGDFIAEGTLSVIDTIRLEELSGGYSYVKKAKEEYRQHIETYTTTDSKGHTHVHTRTYWSWDVMKTWKYASERARFLGKEFAMKDVYSPVSKRDVVIDAPRKMFENKTRYVYYTAPPSFDGIMVGSAMNKQYIKPSFIEGMTPEGYIKKAEKSLNNGTTAFWVLWLLFTAGLIVGFYYLENKWLY